MEGVSEFRQKSDRKEGNKRDRGEDSKLGWLNLIYKLENTSESG